MSFIHMRRLGIAAALATSALLGACGDDSSGPNPGSHPAAMLLDSGDSPIDPRDYESGYSTLFFAVTAAGFPLDTTTAEDSTAIAQLLAGKDVFFLPANRYPGTTQALNVIKDFVQGGGTLVLAGGQSHLTWVNTTFGFTLGGANGYYERHTMPKANGADGTPFEGGPASILSNSDVDLLDAGALPPNTALAYLGPDGDTDASVAVIPSGAGRIVYLGWDFYDAAPIGLQDGGWRKILSLTAGF